VDLAAPLGAPVTMLSLEHQMGDAEVLYVGRLFGETVVTYHLVREGGVVHAYLLLFGHLDRPGDNVRRGQRLAEGALVGFIGNTGSPEYVHLHLEARRVRDGVDVRSLPGDALNARDNSIVSDPRNVLPLRLPPQHPARCAIRPSRPVPRYWLGELLKLALE